MLIPQVIGEPGVDLNYEETVVYDNDAIRPAFLVVYGDIPHWQKIRSKLQSLAFTLNMQIALIEDQLNLGLKLLSNLIR